MPHRPHNVSIYCHVYTTTLCMVFYILCQQIIGLIPWGKEREQKEVTLKNKPIVYVTSLLSNDAPGECSWCVCYVLGVQQSNTPDGCLQALFFRLASRSELIYVWWRLLYLEIYCNIIPGVTSLLIKRICWR